MRDPGLTRRTAFRARACGPIARCAVAVPDRIERAVFDVARHIPATVDRQIYVEHACGEDRELRARVEALLRVHDEDLTFLESPAEGVRGAFADPPGEGPGPVIGPYTLLR